MEDVRYRQRFDNFEKSFFLLKSALDIKEPSIVEKAGAIQFFETTFELSWKMMKDYLEFLGYVINSPRDAIKRSFAIDIIIDGNLWLDVLADRNRTTHTYDEKMANEVYGKIRNQYYPLLLELHLKFNEIICSD